MSLTLADIRTRVSGAIGLSNQSGSSEQSLIDSWANEAVEQYLIETKCRVFEATMDLTAGDGNYTIGSPILAFKAVWLEPASGNNTLLQRVTTEELLERRVYASTGDPQVYAYEGANLLMIDPVAQSSSDVLMMLYVPTTNTMSAPADSPTDSGVPSWGCPAIEAYTKWKAADWDDDTSSQVGLVYKAEWDEHIKKGKARLNRMGGPLAPARPRRSRRYVPRSPGVDLGN